MLFFLTFYWCAVLAAALFDWFDLQIGFTPLHLAIEHKHDGMVALLLKLGADPDIPNKVRQQQQQRQQQRRHGSGAGGGIRKRLL
jgi:hypothetical protein